jgi:hypothetical protein
LLINATAKIYPPISAKNSEGTIVKTWGYKTGIDPAETLRVDVQPNSLNEAQLMQWGLSNRVADTKKVFFRHSKFIQQNNRAVVTMDNNPGVFEYYEIKARNGWNIHGESIFVPVMGE